MFYTKSIFISAANCTFYVSTCMYEATITEKAHVYERPKLRNIENIN